MAARPRPLPDHLSGRPFTIAEGRAAGLSAWRLHPGRTRRPTRGVRSDAPAPVQSDVPGRCRELRPVLPATAVFSRATALALLGIDEPRGLRRPEAIHVDVPAHVRRPRRAGVVAHTWSGRRRAVLLPDGLPVTTVEQIWVDVAAELSVTELVVLGDAMLRRRHARTALSGLAAAVARLPPGSRGLRRLRAALPLLRPGTDSCPETRLRLVIVAAGLPCPEVNRAVHDRAGRFVALPDLSYHAERIAIEYDGDVHRTDRRTWQRDIARRHALETAGWRVLTCTAADLTNPAGALAWIRRALRDAHHRESRS